jgi:ribosomal protein S28E/S33
VKKEDESSGNFFVILPKTGIQKRKTKIRIGLYEGNRRIDVISTNFLGPVSN